MNLKAVKANSADRQIRFNTHRFDTQFLTRHWLQMVIQEVPGGRYWERHGSWTSDLQHAACFVTCTDALSLATRLGLSAAQLVLIRQSKAYGVVPLYRSLGSSSN